MLHSAPARSLLGCPPYVTQKSCNVASSTQHAGLTFSAPVLSLILNNSRTDKEFIPSNPPWAKQKL